ncbi:rhamnulokinase [Rubellicoccus peritrichatus]|uniref:FGGY family carbohydrate kinase n=1 Tax=Rubellicoccus peritrichatus TaxID=3080537 RepID=A0AAQ3QTR5_9BACT|nr:FGGY-family carbohydrate kinase [Puniceicoccus sp. CR14]WOO41611.1 FGGY family carbohydrate kinase [Puniceicoccus sp. CR14]
MKRTHCAAIDLGATSGRVIVGSYSNDGLELTEVRRFPNAFHRLGKNEYWDLGGFFSEIKKGLIEAKKIFPELASCGVDTWGVDYAMVDRSGRLVFPVHAYRDERTEPLLKKLKSSGKDKNIYDWTGIPGINYNTTLQLAETIAKYPHLKDVVDRVLLLADYFNYQLCGAMANEFSLASTGQLLQIDGDHFSKETLDFFDIPKSWFAGPTKAGRKLGKVSSVEGLDDVEVVLVPGHDTSCAFEAIPQIGNDILISAGTWLLTGGLTEKPATGEEAFELGVSNERAGNGGHRPNKILLGLWLLEKTLPAFETRPSSEAEWKALIEAAEDEAAPGFSIDTSDQTLFNPTDMKAAIDANLKRQGVSELPQTLPAYTRLICDSLGRSVAQTVEKFSRMTSTQFDNVAIVGGGSKNRLLCQRIADFSGLPVTSYNLEGTAVGNIGYQLLGLGRIDSLDTFRANVSKDLTKHVYEPKT